MLTAALSLLLAAATTQAAALPAELPADERAIIAAMNDSAAAWNAGDVDGFMAIYSDAPETSFVTSKGLVRGKAQMAERYRGRYDFTNLAKRGRLRFETLDYRPLGGLHVLYIARFVLTYGDGREESGTTTLIFAHEGSGWHIIADHSS